MRDYVGALEYLEKALAIYLEKLGDNHVETAGVPQTDGSVLGEVQPARHQGPVHLHQELLVTVNQNLQTHQVSTEQISKNIPKTQSKEASGEME